jgi:hypothetical protein
MSADRDDDDVNDDEDQAARRLFDCKWLRAPTILVDAISQICVWLHCQRWTRNAAAI